MPVSPRAGVACLVLLALLAGCGGGRDASPRQVRGASASTSGGGSLSPAAQAALPSHVSARDVIRGANGCYSYQVGTADLGYVAPLIGDDGQQVCT